MIKINISTPSGVVFENDNVKFIVCHEQNLEFGVLSGHVPIVSSLKEG